MNNKELLKLLNITLNDGEVNDEIIITETNGFEKTITLSKKHKEVLCSTCSSKMYSKAYYYRKIKHPVLQDGYRLKLIVKQRKYRCTNKECNHYLNEAFGFMHKYKQTTKLIPYLQRFNFNLHIYGT